jgi:transcription antitermination factor NusG
MDLAPVGDGAKLYPEISMGFAQLTLAATNCGVELGAPELTAAFEEQHWYAVYTCVNQEKRVASEIAARGVEHFLPMYRSVRRWKDRRVTLELPLFPGYLFTRLALRDRLRILTIRNVVRFVGFAGQATALPEEEMNRLRAGLSGEVLAEPHPFLVVGRRVRITGGPFTGLTGVLKRHKGRFWVIVSIDLVQRSMIVNVEGADVAPLI